MAGRLNMEVQDAANIKIWFVVLLRPCFRLNVLFVWGYMGTAQCIYSLCYTKHPFPTHAPLRQTYALPQSL